MSLETLLSEKYDTIINPVEIFEDLIRILRNYWLQKPYAKYYGSFTDVEYVKRGWLWQVLKFSYEYDADSVVLMDNRLLQVNNANDDSDASKFIQNKI